MGDTAQRIDLERVHRRRCPFSAGLVAREVALYPRTDDAEVTVNFIGIAPVVEGPVVQLPIHDNDLIKKSDLLYKIDDRP